MNTILESIIPCPSCGAARGEVVLVTDAGEEILRPGDCAGFKAGVKAGDQADPLSLTSPVAV
jgi:hypothetical protein